MRLSRSSSIGEHHGDRSHLRHTNRKSQPAIPCFLLLQKPWIIDRVFLGTIFELRKRWAKISITSTLEDRVCTYWVSVIAEAHGLSWLAPDPSLPCDSIRR